MDLKSFRQTSARLLVAISAATMGQESQALEQTAVSTGGVSINISGNGNHIDLPAPPPTKGVSKAHSHCGVNNQVAISQDGTAINIAGNNTVTRGGKSVSQGSINKCSTSP